MPNNCLYQAYILYNKKKQESQNHKKTSLNKSHVEQFN